MRKRFPLTFALAATSFAAGAAPSGASAQVASTPALPLAPRAQAPPATEESPRELPQYIRFLEASDALEKSTDGAVPSDRLQTAVVRFEKEGTQVDLVGVVHLGDAAYYEALREKLAGYDTVLYEMVGGPHRREEDLPGASAEIASLRQLQQLAKSFLGLEFQLDAIDYQAPNFVHADVAWAEFEKLMAARNETMLTLLERATALADAGEVAGLPSDPAASEAFLGRVFSAVLRGDSAELKRSVAPFLSEAESFIARLEGEDGTVLVSERNRVVMEKLAELRAERGKGTYAIFYGAGHMPDLERRLLEAGFEKGESLWHDAWTIPRGSSAASGTPPALDGILRLISESPEVKAGLEKLGTSLEDLGGAIKALPEGTR